MTSQTAAIAAPPAARPVLLALLMVTAGGALAGFSPIFARLSEAGPLATAGWRMAIAAVTFLPFLGLPFLGLENGRRSSGGRGILMLAGVCFAIDIGFFHISLNMTSVAHATLIVNMAPLVALGAGLALFGERLGAAKFGGLVLALGGALLMTWSRAGVEGTLTGDALAFIGMFGYALYLIVVKQARARHHVLEIMVWSSAASACVLFAAAAIHGESILPATAYGWGVLLGLGLVTHVAGQGLVASGMRETPVGLASILLLSQPVVAGVAAWVIFNEDMGVTELSGVVLVLCGMVLASRSRG
jgi:drug/metabolite transporter (DMT)-like permease